MSEWLDLMLEEIARKKREAEEAQAEKARLDMRETDETPSKPAQSK